MFVNKEQWLSWKEHPVTQALNNQIQDRILECTDKVFSSSDPEFDRFVKGMVHAFREILEFEVEFPIEENDEIQS